MKRRQTTARVLTLALIASFTLSACGIRGDLNTPPPLWGDDIRTDAQKAEAAKAEAQRAKRKAKKAE